MNNLPKVITQLYPALRSTLCATFIDDEYKKLVKFGHVVFEIRKQTERQTDRQTGTLITILRPPTGSQ